jgi:ankyrin repeat protein
MVRDLLRTGSPDLRDSIGLSALDLAAMAEHGLQALRVLLTDDQARAMAVNENDMTALHWAAALGRCEAVQALLDAGADPLALTKASIISTETPGGPAGGVLRILER